MNILRKQKQLQVFLMLISAALIFAGSGCSTSTTTKVSDSEEEPIARTEFTDRILNFFEYSPLKAGVTSQFLIHLTDLSDGTPVEKAEVKLTIRKQGGGGTQEVTAKIGRVTGIYVADVELSDKGNYDIEFRIKNDKLNEQMKLEDFEVK